MKEIKTKKEAIEVLSENPASFCFVSKKLHNNKDVVMTALRASAERQQDVNIMLILMWIGDKLRQDAEIIEFLKSYENNSK